MTIRHVYLGSDPVKDFWKQVAVAKQIVSRGDKTVLPRLEHWLSDEDRHRRGFDKMISVSEVARAALATLDGQ